MFPLLLITLFIFPLYFTTAYMSSPPCCPANSEPFLATTYKYDGVVHSTPVCDYYLASSATDSKGGIILVPDIFGWNGGRTRAIADYLAINGYHTVVPKLLTPALDGGTDGDGNIIILFPSYFS